ncbi:MAG: hypothetical protein JWP34_4444 [Massilia sp.]|nr:hypothetical protein [Massilia sp.]
MTQPDQLSWRAVLAACGLLAAGAVQAQTTPEQVSTDSNVPPATAQKQASEIARGDPARWYREDVTAAARLRTLQKEIGAGLQEAQGECRKLPAAERGACMRDARATYSQDMANARASVMSERPQRH